MIGFAVSSDANVASVSVHCRVCARGFARAFVRFFRLIAARC
jgi:hypothetical protein